MVILVCEIMIGVKQQRFPQIKFVAWWSMLCVIMFGVKQQRIQQVKLASSMVMVCETSIREQDVCGEF